MDGYVYRCNLCGNTIHSNKIEEIRKSVGAVRYRGTKGQVRIDISPVCMHKLPYTMRRMLANAEFKAEHPRESPSD